MRWTSLLAIYFLVWMFSVFLVLPFGVRTTPEVGGELVPGQAESAPHDINVKRILIRVTIVATSLWLLFVLNYIYGWVTPESLDMFGTIRASKAG